MMAQSPVAQTATWEDDLQAELIGALYTGGYELSVGAAAGHLLKRDARSPVLVPNGRPILQIPPAPVRFVGRVQEVAQAVLALKSGRSVELWGELGIGKSALLRYLAHHPEVTTSHPDGILNLGQLRPMTDRQWPTAVRGASSPENQRSSENLGDLRQTLIDTFFYTYPDGPLPAAAIEQALGEQQALILVDGGQWSGADLQKLQATLACCTFLVASRQPRLTAIRSPEGLVIELKALPLTAMQQLVEQVYSQPLTPTELGVVVTLWERFQGNPQRVLQAAAIVQQGGWAWTDLAAAQPGLSAPAAQRALAHQAWQSLATPERWILALLMAMPGVGLRQEQIAQITGPRDPRSNLQALVQWRLVMGQGDRYVLATALKGAVGADFDPQPWLERALTHWLTWMEQADVEAVLVDLEGVMFGLRWAVGQGRWAEVLQMARALDIPLTLGKQWETWGRVLQWALQAAWHLQDPAAEAWVWHQLGTRALLQEDVTTAYDALSQALKLRQDLGDRLGAALTQHNRDGLMQAVVPADRRPLISTRRQTALALILLSLITFSIALGLGLGIQKWLHIGPDLGPAYSDGPTNLIGKP
jgi:hypothetical protein